MSAYTTNGAKMTLAEPRPREDWKVPRPPSCDSVNRTWRRKPLSKESRKPSPHEVGQVRLQPDRVEELTVVRHRDRIEVERDERQGRCSRERARKPELTVGRARRALGIGL